MTEYTVKCSLARLGAAPEVRCQIDLQVECYHALALRGFHVASHTALRMLREGSTPAVFLRTAVWQFVSSVHPVLVKKK